MNNYVGLLRGEGLQIRVMESSSVGAVGGRESQLLSMYFLFLIIEVS